MKRNRIIKRCWSLLLLVLAPWLAGCGDSAAARFHSNLVQMAAAGVSEKHQQQIADILQAMYGTPDDPFVLAETGLDIQKIRQAAGPVEGYTQGLFRLHCVHCHGITGDGMGPTAFFLKPYPRDYREGWYKFKSTPSNLPPTHDDLVRTLQEGIPGTAMPSFKLLPKKEIEALVEYVEYLSMRGQTEIALIQAVGDLSNETDDLPTTREFLVGETLTGVANKWKDAASQVAQVPPPPKDFGTPDSIEAGRKVFYGKGACVKCHGPTALGDGQMVFDDWNKFINELTKKTIDQQDKLADDKDISSAERAEKSQHLAEVFYALHVDSLPPRESQPRNLRQGIFRGGRQPYEIFYRLRNGVFPSGMPGAAAEVTTDEIWHMVDFVLDLPYEAGSQYHTDQHMQSAPRERL